MDFDDALAEWEEKAREVAAEMDRLWNSEGRSPAVIRGYRFITERREKGLSDSEGMLIRAVTELNPTRGAEFAQIIQAEAARQVAEHTDPSRSLVQERPQPSSNVSSRLNVHARSIAKRNFNTRYVHGSKRQKVNPADLPVEDLNEEGVSDTQVSATAPSMRAPNMENLRRHELNEFGLLQRSPEALAKAVATEKAALDSISRGITEKKLNQVIQALTTQIRFRENDDELSALESKVMRYLDQFDLIVPHRYRFNAVNMRADVLACLGRDEEALKLFEDYRAENPANVLRPQYLIVYHDIAVRLPQARQPFLRALEKSFSNQKITPKLRDDFRADMARLGATLLPNYREDDLAR